jgi:DNA-binding MarR family transcriptional regulator
LELVATFYDASHARDYADRENSRAAERTAELTEAPTRPVVAPPATASELSARQSAVLEALRAKMDANKHVEAKAAVLAEAANVPLGSLHAVLQSLEKKQLIKTVRAGSARAPAVYQVA